MAFAEDSTELECINELLTAGDESPIDSIEDVETVPEAKRAQEILYITNRQFQALGHSFNTEEAVDFNLNFMGWLNVPDGILRIESTKGYQQLTIQSGRVYDKLNGTFQLGDAGQVQQVNIVYRVAFKDLPEVARRYLTLSCVRIYLSRYHGESTLIQLMKEQEIEAKNAFNASEFDDGNYSMLDGTDAGSIYYNYWRRG